MAGAPSAMRRKGLATQAESDCSRNDNLLARRVEACHERATSYSGPFFGGD